MFRYTLAFLKHKEKEILAIKESGDLYVIMRKLGEKMIDVNTISQVMVRVRSISDFDTTESERKLKTYDCIIMYNHVLECSLTTNRLFASAAHWRKVLCFDR